METENIGEVVVKYLDQQKLTLRGFADAISEATGLNLSHVTIINWRNANTIPETDLMISLLIHSRDWRFDFAMDVLRAKRPDIWGDTGELRKAMENLRTQLLPVQD